MITNRCKVKLQYRRFIYVIVYTAAIYLTLPLARDISNFFREYNLLKYLVFFIVIAFVAVCCFRIFRYIGFKVINVIIILSFFLVYLSIINSYDVIVEKIHFVEYGLLAYLVFDALKKMLPRNFLYPVTLIAVTLIGWGDEIIQHFLPDRVYDLRDVWLNALSGLLILLSILVVEKLKPISRKQL